MEASPILKVVTIPMIQNNYGYLVIDTSTKKAGVVDPVEPATVAAAVEEAGVSLECILTTHSHWDHSGGNEEMAKLFPDITVYGGRGDEVSAVTVEVDDSSSFKIGNVHVQVVFTPCHTPGHVCYVATGSRGHPSAVFTGDTMFVGGCGNLNRGTAKQMHDALLGKLGKLPDETRVYVGHEYTVNNLLFAHAAEPDNEAVTSKLMWALKETRAGRATVPSTIESEKETNPFMRVNEVSLQAFTKLTDPVDVLRSVRKAKDVYGKRPGYTVALEAFMAEQRTSRDEKK